jgi:hypothetical protein
MIPVRDIAELGDLRVQVQSSEVGFEVMAPIRLYKLISGDFFMSESL